MIFCIIAGALYAYVLYLSSSKSDFPRRIKWILFSARLISVTVISFLLLSPLLRTVTRYVEKPIIIIAQDNSRSIITNKDSGFYKNEYPGMLDKFKEELNKDFEIASYNFGGKVTGKEKPFIEKETNMSLLFDYLNNAYSNRNVGALVLSTDGLYNRGENPLYSSGRINYPVYTVALGDTNLQKDIIIKKINYNRTVLLGNTFPVELLIEANKCRGSRVKLSISHIPTGSVEQKEESVFTKDIGISSDIFEQTIPVQIESKKAGIQYYKVTLTQVEGEISKTNNEKEFFIEVLSSKEKILLLSSSPHPDISAIKEAIEANINYHADAFVLSEFNRNINDYNVIILHQVPSESDPASLLLSNIIKAEIPVLYIIGTKTNLSAYNNLLTGMTITESKLCFIEALPYLNNEFPLFTVSRELSNEINNYPPLLSPFGNYNIKPSANVLFYQRIGNVSTRKPLIIFNQSGNIRGAVISGEGIWKWRLFDYLQKNNHDLFNELINKIIQYLSIRTEKSHLRIISSGSYSENEQISLDAEVYNDSYELINEPDVNMTIISSNNKKYPYVFSKTGNAYHLDAGIFPSGIYRYEATVKLGSNIYKKEGEFTVSSINLETMNTLADHRLLYNISKKHGGEMFYPSQLDRLADVINKREDIKTISYSQKRFNDVVNLTWVFFLIIALLTGEWFLRKYSGTY
jgi:hypothetical protein